MCLDIGSRGREPAPTGSRELTAHVTKNRAKKLKAVDADRRRENLQTRAIGRTGVSFLASLLALLLPVSPATATSDVRLTPIGKGWARNQVNAVIFRKNSVTTHGNTQYVAFYDGESRLVLAKREVNSTRWQVQQTPYRGKTTDAHNAISLAVDGDGFLHLAWNHHVSRLQYCRSRAPGVLELTEPLPMLGDKEERLTYPEFYNLADGNLLFLYRDGVSGGGNLILNRYDSKTKKWSRLQDRLIDGEGERNAYWQMTIDGRGVIHLSWVWRETPDVATNHDLCYAKSADGGRSWQKSSGEAYQLPITAATAEYAWRIAPGSELINQTSMSADANGNPYIATYWRPAGAAVPQYHVVYHDGARWQTSQVSRRVTPFTLSGGGTRRIPISRPQILVRSRRGRVEAFLLFRDSERGSRVSVARCADLRGNVWTIKDLTSTAVRMWEPTYDEALWRRKQQIHLFVQEVGQGEAEGVEEIAPQMVSILEWTP